MAMNLKAHWRTMRQASWLGWQLEANWTSPWLFLAYSIMKPIAGTLILVVMYLVVLQGVGNNIALFSFMYVGNAFYVFVAQVMLGATSVILEDREHYHTLKQIYIAPISLYAYIIGRTLSKAVIAAIACVITMAFGMVALGVPVQLLQVDYLLLAVAMVIGLACIFMIGIALAGVTFLVAKHSTGINEGIAGMLYLFSGVVYPLSVLPSWGQAVGHLLPTTYWLELVRRALLPNLDISAVSGLGGVSTLEIMAALTVTTIAFFALSAAVFRYADRRARSKGKVDMITSY
ncbi:MAG: ABC transporter permease [Methanomassiliicoccales archaeon]